MWEGFGLEQIGIPKFQISFAQSRRSRTRSRRRPFEMKIATKNADTTLAAGVLCCRGGLGGWVGRRAVGKPSLPGLQRSGWWWRRSKSGALGERFLLCSAPSSQGARHTNSRAARVQPTSRPPTQPAGWRAGARSRSHPPPRAAAQLTCFSTRHSAKIKRTQGSRGSALTAS